MKPKLYTNAQSMEFFLTQRLDFYSVYVDEIMMLHEHIHQSGDSLVEFHKKKLGRQTLCWQGSEFRYWVWQREMPEPVKYHDPLDPRASSKEGWQVSVNNKKGVCFNVTVDRNPLGDNTRGMEAAIDRAFYCWENYLCLVALDMKKAHSPGRMYRYFSDKWERRLKGKQK